MDGTDDNIGGFLLSACICISLQFLYCINLGTSLVTDKVWHMLITIHMCVNGMAKWLDTKLEVWQKTKQRAREQRGGGRWLEVAPCQIFPWSQYESQVQTDHRPRPDLRREVGMSGMLQGLLCRGGLLDLSWWEQGTILLLPLLWPPPPSLVCVFICCLFCFEGWYIDYSFSSSYYYYHHHHYYYYYYYLLLLLLLLLLILHRLKTSNISNRV